jgi:hypothetical protein
MTLPASKSIRDVVGENRPGVGGIPHMLLRRELGYSSSLTFKCRLLLSFDSRSARSHRCKRPLRDPALWPRQWTDDYGGNGSSPGDPSAELDHGGAVGHAPVDRDYGAMAALRVSSFFGS